jgi:nucleoporin NUP159
LTTAVSFVSWLETHTFLVVHTSTKFDLDSSPPSTFHLITRQNSTYLFQKIPEFSYCTRSSRSPPYYFMSRLREYPPSLKDALVIASTLSTDTGLLTLSTNPLTSNVSAEKITNVFTVTTPDDARRAELPMTEDDTNTWPIGTGFDLSVKEKAIKPIPSEEIDESATPLPAYMVLSNVGVLSAWWFVYSESVRGAMAYPGLGVEGAQQTNQQQQPPAGFGVSQTPSSAFGAAATLESKPSAFAAAVTSRSTPGQNSSMTFGQPAFGSSSALGATQAPAFGSVGGIGAKASPWGTPGSSSATSKATQPAATFGSTSTGPSTGGFGSYVNMGGFASAASQPSSGSIFSQPAKSSPSDDMKVESAFGAPQRNGNQTGLFGSGPAGFSIGSTFKGDGTATDDGPKPDASAANAFFGNAFGSSLTQEPRNPAAPGSPITKEADMEDEDSADEEIPRTLDSGFVVQRATAPSTTSFPAFGPSSSTKPDIFESSKPSEPAATSEAQPSSPVVDQKPIAANEPASASPVVNQEPVAATEPVLASPKIKPEPRDGSESPIGVDESILEAPLPPDTTSKISYAAGDSSTSSSATQRAIPEDAPLPPDFVGSKKSNGAPVANDPFPPESTTPKKESDSIEADIGLPQDSNSSDVKSESLATNAPLPPDSLPSSGSHSNGENESSLALPDDADEGFDDEGSGEDITKDVSIDVTPESSFAGSFDRSPVGGRFTNISRHPQSHPSRPLFGEIGSNSVPFLPPPSSKAPESPRSPSPIRVVIPAHRFRPESSRSVSAPNSGIERAEGRPGLMRPPISDGSFSKMGKSADERRFEEMQRAMELRARQLAEEEQDLNDEHDEQVREELASEVQPTRELRPFLAHQDYVGEIEKPGIPGQVERVYRDINSMIDTLGLNARSLEAFVKGHCEGYEEGERSKDDLEDEDGWCLIEMEELSALEQEVAGSLDVGRVSNVREKLECCHDLLKDLVKSKSYTAYILILLKKLSTDKTQ